jgi:hypothetical protein
LRTVEAGGVTYHIVSNGDQTDTIADFLEQDNNFENAVRSRTVEPDVPNYTSRISGLVASNDNQIHMAICRRNSQTSNAQYNFFSHKPQDGLGLCIHTYQSDGEPLPAFEGDAYSVPLLTDIRSTAHLYWGTLNKENRVALVAKSIDMQTDSTDFYIINRLNL